KITWMARSARLSRERTVAPNSSPKRAAVASASKTASDTCARPVGLAIRPPLEGLRRLEHAEYGAQAVGNLAQRGARLHGREDQGDQILVALGPALEVRHGALVRSGVAPGAEGAQALGALGFHTHIRLEDLGRLRIVFDELVHADHDRAPGFDFLLVLVRRD